MVMHESIFPLNAKYATAPPYGPRRVVSCSSISSIARIFGAPVSVPAGENERKRSRGVGFGRSLASTSAARGTTGRFLSVGAKPGAQTETLTQTRGRAL